MVGAVAAIRRWLTMNHEDRLADAERMSGAIIERVQGIPGVTVIPLDNVVGHLAFGLRLEFDRNITGMTASDVVAQLKKGDPPVFTRTRAGEDYISIHVFGRFTSSDLGTAKKSWLGTGLPHCLPNRGRKTSSQRVCSCP
jgi:hypothetical protein